jgi:hypothetical protein
MDKKSFKFLLIAFVSAEKSESSVWGTKRKPKVLV